jgi:DNA-binding transcriptional LysR family regulator
MKLRHLRFFIAVVEYGGVGKAAERLGMSQPAISAGIKLLQEELGEPLFERSGGRHRIAPTPAALRFHEHAREILARCDTAVAAFARPEPRPAAIRVGILQTLSSGDVANVLSQSMLSGEPVWKISEGNAADIAKWLAQGQIDIAWTAIERTTRNSVVLWREAFAVLMARNHRLARRSARAVKVADLAGEPMVLRTSCEMRSGKLRASGIHCRVVARASRDDLVLRLVAQGVGLAIAPRSFANAEIVALPFADVDLTRDIGLRWRPELEADQVDRVRQCITLFGKPTGS